jgi:peptidoglycan hydrolase-like protein with peptidoglycan-binding domain
MRKILVMLLVLVPLGASAATFNLNLFYGSKGAAVIQLQNFLTTQNLYTGPVTGNFLLQTKGAVQRFQSKFDITPTGYFGPQSRVKANELLAASQQPQETVPKGTASDVNSLAAQIKTLQQQLLLLQQKLAQTFSPATSTTQPDIPPYAVPVLQISYYSLSSDGIHLDQNETGASYTLTEVRARVSQISSDLIQSLEQGSRYINDPTQTPSLKYTVYDSREFLSLIPKSVAFAPSANHFEILNGSNICDYVDNRGVKEVWIWMYHVDGVVAPIESNMSIGRVSQNYWTHQTYGDVSNSWRQDDLPICNRTYTVYDYNYTRGVAEALENHGHQLEALFGFLNGELFQNRFMRPYGKTDAVNACGNTHFPPNGTSDYDWRNQTVVQSNCSDWHPDGSGAAASVSCLNWTCEDDGGASYKVWWMRRIPGNRNNLYYNGRHLQNWWKFVGDFDNAIKNGKDLVM